MLARQPVLAMYAFVTDIYIAALLLFVALSTVATSLVSFTKYIILLQVLLKLLNYL